MCGLLLPERVGEAMETRIDLESEKILMLSKPEYRAMFKASIMPRASTANMEKKSGARNLSCSFPLSVVTANPALI